MPLYAILVVQKQKPQGEQLGFVDADALGQNSTNQTSASTFYNLTSLYFHHKPRFDLFCKLFWLG